MNQEDQLFVRDGFRHFRRTYSVVEVRWGFVVLVVLAAIAAWVGWSGSVPRPGLYSEGPIPGGQAKQASAADRGPIPDDLAPAGWVDSGVSSFAADNLYEKINGRADFFLSKGFERLYATTLSVEGEPTVTVDIELYDMGSLAGAQSAFTAERRSDAKVVSTDQNLYYESRNAAYVAQGSFYLRAIGADDSQQVREALTHVRTVMTRTLASDERPWAFALFVDALGFDAGDVAFFGNRAFSIEDAPATWVAQHEDDSEWFIALLASEEDAQQAELAFVRGFSSYGSPSEASEEWIADEFLGLVSTARATGAFVIGVHRIRDVAAGSAALARLEGALGSLSADILERASTATGGAATPEPPSGGQVADDPEPATIEEL